VRLSERHPVPPRAARAGSAGAVVLVLAVALAAGAPAAVSRQYDRFVRGDRGTNHAVLRDRLSDPGANGRLTLWQVALREFDGAPVKGTGAGTYEVYWTPRHSALDFQVLDAHSVYMENLGELGVVGVGLLLAFVLGSLVAIARRVRGPDRALYAAILAAVLAWALQAGVDWDWEMPAATLPVFLLAGAALWRPADGAPAPSRRRPLLGLVVLVAAAAPALVNVSQRHLDASLGAFDASDCATATTEARSSLEPLSFRRTAHEILGYCDAATGQTAQALVEMGEAIRDDPQNWEPRYGLAVVTAAAGRDPRPAIRAALALDPYDPVVVKTAGTLRRDPRARWAADANAADLPIGKLYGPVLADLRAGP
jgi:hypothetical protein